MAPVPFGQWAIKIKPGCFLRPYKDNHHNLVDTVYERKFIVTGNLFPVTGNKFHVTRTTNNTSCHRKNILLQ